MPGEFLIDLYELLVVNIFGSILVATLAVAALITIIFLVCKVRPGFLVIWLTFYFVAMASLYLKGLGLLVGWLIASVILVRQIYVLFFGVGAASSR